ncbi:hypothetical protein K3495_g14733 [Podosphaera aphanis]|nr:hypothetical protein K3495_g14733 [Podosphaera aphanis]
MASYSKNADAPMTGNDITGNNVAEVNLNAQDLRDLLQLVAERRQQPAHLAAPSRRARRDFALPKWSGRIQDFNFYIARLEMRIESDFAPFYDGKSIYLGMIDTLPDNLKGRVSNWFEARRIAGSFYYADFIQYFKDSFADRQAQQSASEVLDRMEQGECQFFGDFYQDFEHQLALGGGDAVYTAVGKTQKLKAALNGRLRRALIGVRLPDPAKYQEWVQEVRDVALELES